MNLFCFSIISKQTCLFESFFFSLFESITSYVFHFHASKCLHLNLLLCMYLNSMWTNRPVFINDSNSRVHVQFDKQETIDENDLSQISYRGSTCVYSLYMVLQDINGKTFEWMRSTIVGIFYSYTRLQRTVGDPQS